VEAIAERLELPLTVQPPGPDRLPDALYVLMTDGQIMTGGGNYSQLRRHLDPAGVVALGIFADTTFKDALRKAWSRMTPLRPLEDRLIDAALLSRARTYPIPGLRGTFERAELLDRLHAEFAAYDRWLPADSGPKVRANWFHFISRGLRWAQAHVADLAFYATPVFPYSDSVVVGRTITSPAWANFNHDRLRLLILRLLPSLDVPYADGQPGHLRGSLRRVWDKLYHEYPGRLLSRRKAATVPAPIVPVVDPQEVGFEGYFNAPVTDFLADKSIPSSVRRTAVTLYYVLAYLNAPG
jgi:hypothetical protein